MQIGTIVCHVQLYYLNPEIRWPRGTYSLPKAASGCPPGFASGCVHQDNEDSRNANRFHNTHLISGEFGRNIRICYCTRLHDDTSSAFSWPAGQYCIARRGGSCPSGFANGDIYWDDEDSRNANHISGHVPDGVYNSNTRIYYCCRRDGSRANPILLPTSTRFILYQHHSRGCQAVSGMRATEIHVRFDDEDSRNRNTCGGAHPYDTGCSNNHMIYLCYYS